ncbi:EamA family transporter, partial [Pseudomonas sp. HMWF007]
MANLAQTHSQSSEIPVYLTLAAVTMVWGGTFVAGR